MSSIGRWTIAAGMFAVVAWTQEWASSLPHRAMAEAPYSSSQDDQEEPTHNLRREGTKLINVVGRFENEGDSATFVTKEDGRFGGLPNLSLERIITTLKTVDDPSNVWWSINGTVTEFSGRNYVLVTRAVFKATSPPPPPQAHSLAK